MMNGQFSTSRFLSLTGRIALACLAIAVISLSAQAQGPPFRYDLVRPGVEPGSDVVFASLYLNALPATYTDVDRLEFTPAGQAHFGYPSVYPGTFDGGSLSIGSMTLVDDGHGGLGGLVVNPDGEFLDDVYQLWDIDPPPSAHHPSGTDQLFMEFYSTSLDWVRLTPADYVPGKPDDRWRFVTGSWRFVPEPDTSVLLLTAVLFGAGLRRRTLSENRQHVAG